MLMRDYSKSVFKIYRVYFIMASKSLKKLREKIDLLDDKIVRLLNERAKVVLEIAARKKALGRKIYAPAREKRVLERLAKIKGILPAKALEDIYREIISTSRALEKEIKVAYLGPKTTFTEMAALKKFGSAASYIPLPSIPDVFQEVERGNADFGVVPIESSSEGAVSSTLDMFFDSQLNICGEIVIDVDHCLLSKFPTKKIKKIYSHPQAFGQCENWIKKNLPDAKIIEVSSTARAAELAAKEKESAAIASALAAKEYNLPIVAKKIQDQFINKTRFLVVGNTKVEATGKDKTSILFTVKHVPGALFRALKAFSDYKINMTKIESRPIKGKLWEYAFFVDFQGHCENRRVKAALKELKKNCIELKILGSYPEED